ncbi:response regulator [Geomesophilobacter sediminis]|uniref:Response regulator n=1 Tax=Geomesophilobacter sediminis TaxID=2798584 RepID=A0A8J7IVU2_9BACT|nr:response regulator [Geomesophilobacter sediminis]MBJ6723377.1 response regulator [Geomesophilobacter sediminis]
MPMTTPAPASEFTLLFVEDDQFSREMVLPRLEQLFARVEVAVDGIQGLERFQQGGIDLVLTDQHLPGMSGLEMTREIRVSDQETPVVLMTSSIDNDILLEAINVGVSRFIPKPYDYQVLSRRLKIIAREIADKRLVERLQQQEVEELRSKDSYHLLQQEAARRKEHHVVRNQMLHQALPDGDGNLWGVEVRYAPRDIMCGDAYTVRRLPDGRLLVFMADAMGSGLSASITAILATSFSNFFVAHFQTGCICGFSLPILVGRFREYLSEILLDDEVLSCGFFLVDLARLELDAALFALPPLLVRVNDGTVQQLRSGNAPFCSYTGAISFTKLDLAGIAELLATTDGVTDAELAEGGAYREVLEEDFRQSPTLNALQGRFRQRVAAGEQDDMTLFQLRRLGSADAVTFRIDPPPTYEGVAEAVEETMVRLRGERILDGDLLDEIEFVLSEAAANAYEHGCLGLGGARKRELLLDGSYDAVLTGSVAPEGAHLGVAVRIQREEGLLTFEVSSSGPGLTPAHFGVTVESTAVNGRGLQMIKSFCDSIFLADEGRRLIMMKSFEGGNYAA